MSKNSKKYNSSQDHKPSSGYSQKNIVSDLTNKLDSQTKSSKLQLGDIYLGDEGAVQVADFLRSFNHYNSIDLRGNNISSAGFKVLCEKFQYCPELQSINAEWNNVGSDSSGLVALHALLRSNQSILSVDLKNNHLKTISASFIANIIRDSSSLQVLDLRWNDIGNEGARIILTSLRNCNRRIEVYLDGNGISEEILAEINEIEFEPKNDYFGRGNNSTVYTSNINTFGSPDHGYIQTEPSIGSHFTPKPINHDFNIRTASSVDFSYNPKPIPLPEYETKPLNSSYISYTPERIPIKPLQSSQSKKYFEPIAIQSTPSITPRRQSIIEPILKQIQPIHPISVQPIQPIPVQPIQPIKYEVRNDRAVIELESVLERERMRAEKADDNAKQAARDLEVEKRYRHEVETKYNQLVDEIHKRDQGLNDAGFELERLRKENIHLKSENTEIKAEISGLNNQFNTKLREVEEKYSQHLREANAEIANSKQTADRNKEAYENHLREAQREYEYKYRHFEEQLKNFSSVNNELADELKKQTEYVQRLKLEQDEQIRRIIQRTREEEAQKFQITLRNSEAKMQGLQDAAEQSNRKNSELIRELQAYERKLKEQQYQAEGEISRCKGEVDRILDQLNQVNLANERLKAEIITKDGNINRLEKESQNYEREAQRVRSLSAEEVDKIRREFDFQRRKYEDNERQFNMKTAELERLLRESQNDTNRIRVEYEKLKEIIQGNVSKAISQTFVNHGRGNTKYDFVDF